MSQLTEWHSRFGGHAWKITASGIAIKGEGHPRSPGEPRSIQYLWEDFGDDILYASNEMQVAADTLSAMVCIEAGRQEDSLRFDPTATREEPGYVSDTQTPHLVSPGLMQTLLSTAQHMAKTYHLVDPDEVDREFLQDPGYSLLMGAAYLHHLMDRYGPDPMLLSAAYNAGGLYKDLGSRWHLRTYSPERLDRFASFFNDFHAVKNELNISQNRLILTTPGPHSLLDAT